MEVDTRTLKARVDLRRIVEQDLGRPPCAAGRRCCGAVRSTTSAKATAWRCGRMGDRAKSRIQGSTHPGHYPSP
jgi:hypothetical protein